jgi:hypothetical protein
MKMYVYLFLFFKQHRIKIIYITCCIIGSRVMYVGGLYSLYRDIIPF